MNKQKVFVSLFSTILLVVLYSCSPTYVANTTNIPLLSGAGEFKANVITGTNDIEPQLALAVTNHFALMTNGSFSFADQHSNSPKRNFLEGAIGYYNSPGTHQVFEIYGGYGEGFVSNNYNLSQSSDRFDANYRRFFIQPNMGYRSRFLEGGLSLRFSYLDISKTMTDKIVSTQNFYFEPTGTIKCGFENFKFTFQLGLSKLIGAVDENFDHHPFIFGVGIQFNFGGKRMPEVK